MKLNLSTGEAADILYADKNANWTYTGARALVEYLEELDIDELDVVALRCDYSQYKSLQDWNREYFGHDNQLHEEADIKEYIQDRGELIEFDGGIIVSSF